MERISRNFFMVDLRNQNEYSMPPNIVCLPPCYWSRPVSLTYGLLGGRMLFCTLQFGNVPLSVDYFSRCQHTILVGSFYYGSVAATDKVQQKRFQVSSRNDSLKDQRPWNMIYMEMENWNQLLHDISWREAPFLSKEGIFLVEGRGCSNANPVLLQSKSFYVYERNMKIFLAWIVSVSCCEASWYKNNTHRNAQHRVVLCPTEQLDCSEAAVQFVPETSLSLCVDLQKANDTSSTESSLLEAKPTSRATSFIDKKTHTEPHKVFLGDHQ